MLSETRSVTWHLRFAHHVGDLTANPVLPFAHVEHDMLTRFVVLESAAVGALRDPFNFRLGQTTCRGFILKSGSSGSTSSSVSSSKTSTLIKAG